MTLTIKIGPLPPELGNLTNLRELYLRNNRLEGEVVELPLQLFQSTYEGPLPYELKQLTNLIQLQLDSNSLDGRIPDGIGRLSKLVVLYLGGNKFERINIFFEDSNPHMVLVPLPSEMIYLSKLKYFEIDSRFQSMFFLIRWYSAVNCDT